ncbi:hypothetical protein [Streptomyces sp. TS71-3]|uniref:hypothetical protein n=1 Tax=Streptomyces sp. TS71-3 TaxID=2733862 RepID=UPI001AFFF416|nr:hypothetical protein [Streptomyces sp. TS71-3]GHJ39165.1 hypothetical protein Sm713_47740 [Streptomyces sp. TS71-3]
MRKKQPARFPAAGATWCHWHKRYTTTGVLVAVIEQASGPGVAVYACAPCQKRFRLTPI